MTDEREIEAAPDDAPVNTGVDALRDRVIAAIRDVYDPEVPVNIYDMGLIYGIDLVAGATGTRVEIRMTLTSPACPVAGSLPGEVEDVVRSVDGIEDCAVTLVWDPPWDIDCLTDEAKLEFGLL